MTSFWYGVMPDRWRRAQQQKVLEELEEWRQDGTNLLSRLVELTDDCDEVHLEALRIRRLLGL